MSQKGLLVAALSTGEATIAAAVVLGVVVLALLLMLRTIRTSSRSAEQRMAALVLELDRRTHEIRQELGDALAREQEQNRIARTLGELTTSIDLAEVLRRAVDAAADLPGADAAHVAVVTPGGEPVVQSVGLTEAEAEDVELVPAISGLRVRTLTLQYDPRTDGNGGVATGLAIPLRSGDVTRGMLTVFSRTPGYAFTPEEQAAAEDLTARAAPAIDNASRYHEAKRLADIDAHTGLHNRRYFHETLTREVARSQRYERSLALVVFDLDDFKEINDQLGHLAGDAVLGQVGDRVRGVVRSSDIACRVGGDEFGIVLPESTLEDAERLCERLKTHLVEEPIQQASRLQISAGIAGLRPQDDAISLFERADDALYRAKEAGKGRVAIATTAIGRAAVEPPPSTISRIQREEG
jgi:diguanylate cyclase (GGDEF)-like protein